MGLEISGKGQNIKMPAGAEEVGLKRQSVHLDFEIVLLFKY